MLIKMLSYLPFTSVAAETTILATNYGGDTNNFGALACFRIPPTAGDVLFTGGLG